MTRPNIFVRFAGSPVGALVLFAVYITVIASWWQGQIAWWLALGSVGAALRTWRCVKRMRAYKQWWAEWHEMGRDDTPSTIHQKPRSSAFLYVLGVITLLLLPLLLGRIHDQRESAALVLIGLTVGFVMFIAISRALLRSWRRRRIIKAEAAPISWMLGRAASSPSRKAALKSLPAYVVPLLNAEKKRNEPKTIEGVIA